MRNRRRNAFAALSRRVRSGRRKEVLGYLIILLLGLSRLLRPFSLWFRLLLEAFLPCLWRFCLFSGLSGIGVLLFQRSRRLLLLLALWLSGLLPCSLIARLL